MTSTPRRNDSTYDYAELADRIETVLGVRPAASTLRAAAAREARSQDYPPRITVGMPAPLRPRTSPARFAADEVDAWLRAHPWKKQRQVLEKLSKVAAAGNQPRTALAVAEARAAGASWTAVTEALRRGGCTIGRARVYQIFRETTGS